jgi:hypothetical protein
MYGAGIPLIEIAETFDISHSTAGQLVQCSSRSWRYLNRKLTLRDLACGRPMADVEDLESWAAGE